MAARAHASATVSFGLVSIPVKLYTSTESSQAIRFNQIHKEDGARVKQQLISSKSGKPVPRDEIVKGYEFAKGQYVLFTKEELKAVEATSTQTIDIAEFLPSDTVDRKYVDKTYYLGTDKGGARAYRLLNKALWETGRVALAKYAARGKQYLVMVRPFEDGLILEQLKYPKEIRPFSEVPIEEAEVKQEELQLAVQLVEQAASKEFKPDDYRDEVREQVMELIERKVAGEDITISPTEEPETKIIDMMEALKASIKQGIGDTERKPAKKVQKKAGKKKATKKKSVSKKRKTG